MLFSKKYILAVIIVMSGFTAKAQQTILTLQQCLDIAIKNNLTVKQDSLSAEQQRVAFVQAKDNLIPTLSGNASRELSTGRAQSPVTGTYTTQSITSDNYGLSGSATVFNGLALQTAIKQASLAFQSGKMAFQAAKDLITINIITNYLQVLNAEETIKQDTIQLALSQESYNRTAVLEKEGANKNASDIYDLNGSLQMAKVNLVNGVNNYNGAVINLFALMNIPYDRNAQLQSLNADDLKGDFGTNPDEVYNTALAGLAQVKAATFARQSAEKGVSYQKALLFPSLILNYGINTNYSNLNADSYSDQFRNNYGTYVGLGLNIPIFVNHYKKNQVTLAKLNLLNYQYIENDTKIQLKQAVERAYYNMTAAYNRYQALEDEVKAYDESFRISKLRFEAGVLNSVDFVTSKNNMDGANLNLISARYDYFIYSKILDYYQGKLSL
jgi:outer membrane protein